MVRVPDLIVEGEAIFGMDYSAENLTRLKQLIRSTMIREDFLTTDAFSRSLEMDTYSTLSFFRSVNFPKKLSLSEKVSCLGNKSREEKLLGQKYRQFLKRMRPDLPNLVEFILTLNHHKGESGFKITIRSEPMIVLQIKMGLKSRETLNDVLYDEVTAANISFVKRVLQDFGSVIVKEPHTRKPVHIRIPIVETLENIGFSEISKSLLEGLSKIENLNEVDGVKKLRVSWERFFKKICSKVDPRKTKGKKDSITFLKSRGVFTDKMSDFCEKIYSYLSKLDHEEIQIDYHDAKLLTAIIESIFENTLLRVKLRK